MSKWDIIKERSRIKAQNEVGAITARWTPLLHHPEQERYWHCPSRFKVIPAGRRSGKTENFKRKLILRALTAHRYIRFPSPYLFFAAAPTRDQAKKIYWNDLKLLSPRRFLLGNPSESSLIIRYINGAEIHVLGMDKPERVEGIPWDGGGLDEYANMKKETWPLHVRPALSDRKGWCDFLGVPEGRNHYYDLYKRAQADTKGDWSAFWWKSADILPEEEILAAMEDLDELSFQQEYEASFINFQGRAYYNFNEKLHYSKLEYDPNGDLIFCFDFNVAPGCAAVLQEMPFIDRKYGVPILTKSITCCIGEVYIPRNSNTELVCSKLAHDWKKHKGRVFCYGDATGGNRGSAKVRGSDWDLVEEFLRPVFGGRLFFNVPTHNPFERGRINSVNSRFLSKAKEVHFLVDPSKAPHVIKDFEGVSLVEGGAGEIDKKKDPDLTHLSDAIGYYISKEFPVSRIITEVHEV